MAVPQTETGSPTPNGVGMGRRSSTSPVFMSTGRARSPMSIPVTTTALLPSPISVPCTLNTSSRSPSGPASSDSQAESSATEMISLPRPLPCN